MSIYLDARQITERNIDLHLPLNPLRPIISINYFYSKGLGYYDIQSKRRKRHNDITDSPLSQKMNIPFNF